LCCGVIVAIARVRSIMVALPASASSSLPSGEEPRIAVLALQEPAPDDETGWLAACYQLTSRVARLSPTSAALDLGPCAEHEALAVARRLADRLRWDDVSVQIGIGPTLPVAQLALLTCPTAQRIALVSLSTLPAFLKPLPIAALCALYLPLPITDETVLRLRRAGIRTLGHIARLEELTLRRQFGSVGIILDALARGEAPTPFHSTPPEPALRFRTRFSTALSLDQTLHRLPGLASEIATRLQGLNQTAGALTLTIWWASGGIERMEHTFPDPIQDTSMLAQRLTSLLVSLVRPQAGRPVAQSGDIERLDVRVTALAPVRPKQGTLWATPAHLHSEWRRRIAALADQLAQRYRRPALLTARATHEAATFSEDRHALRPLTTLPDTAPPPAPPRSREQEREAPIRPHWW
jgi:nucleotidyltransferase/DNA polymerase involved in DNA repair